MDTIHQSSRAGDDKAVFQHYENSDSERNSGREKAGSGSEEAMHESEMDIPVGIGCGNYRTTLTVIR